MSLLTPPGTQRRAEKENRRPITRVAWKEEHEIHTLTAEGSRRPLTRFNTPVRSILKKGSHESLPYMEETQRETTPEPSDPLTDLHYLANPVAKIIAADAALRDLIESYSVLATRLRACITGNTDADASWPLFQPLRKHRDALVDAMCRDLGRALEEPRTQEEQEEAEARFLPSPEKSPKKKGMSAEGIKHARDLCTTSHSVLKLLSAVFTLPAIYGIFEDSHLSDLLTAVLAIPLAPELPTPNARKTYALAIWLLQYQRLPVEVLAPARDRIAYALRRGIEGELGKEGKKGSASDGLKAIHDLSICYPSIFVTAFTDLLPSVYAQLLAPTLVLRTQACHALGGYAYGLSTLPSSATHSRAANYTATFLTKAPLGTPSKKPSSPTKDPAIIRTLRTTLGATDPKHVAQGPVWGLSLLAYFIVILGPQVYLDERMSKCIAALSSLATRHSKSSVRTMACLVWRCMTWSYFRPLPAKLVEEDEFMGDSQETVQDSEEEGEEEYSEDEMRRMRLQMNQGWRLLSSMLDMGAGVSTIGALLAPGVPHFEADRLLRRAFSLLEDLGKRGGHSCQEALWTVAQLVKEFCPPSAKASMMEGMEEDPDDCEWSFSKLLPLGLFSSSPGLLTVDYGSLAPLVKGLIGECPHTEEVRTLTLDEVTTPWIYDCLMQVWAEGLRTMKVQWGEQFPTEILNIWTCLLNAKVLAANDNESDLAEFAGYVVDQLAIILEDNELDFSSKQDDDDRLLILTSPVKPRPGAARALPVYRWKSALKILVIRQLWLIAKSVLPATCLPEAAEALLGVVIKSEVNLVVDVDITDDVRDQWASLCAEIAYLCDEAQLLEFWGMKKSGGIVRCKSKYWNESVRSFVWSHFLETWREEKCTWGSAAILLGAPFLEPNSWDMTNEDVDEWKSFLRCTMDRALDFGIDSASVLDHVASKICGRPSLSAMSSVRVSELLLSNLEITDARSLPSSLFELVNDTSVNTYPPTTRNKVPCVWLLRTLTHSIDACPTELIEQLLYSVQDGVSCWIRDEQSILLEDEYDMDVLPMYQTVLARMTGLPTNPSTLETLAQLVVSAFHRPHIAEGATMAFVEFWQSTYALIPEPQEGWSEKIVSCLQAADLLPESPSTAPLDVEVLVTDDGETDDEEVENQLCNVSAEDIISQPVVKSQDVLAGAFDFRSAPISSIVWSKLPAVPSTPKTSPLASPPLRPKKSLSPVRPLAAPLFSTSPSRSPRSSPHRTPVTPKRRTPGSVRLHAERQEKENMSPIRNIPSVAERIAMRSPVASVLGKRRFEDENEDGENATNKRVHQDVSPTLQNSFLARSMEANVSHKPQSAFVPLKEPVVTSPSSSPTISSSLGIEKDSSRSTAEHSEVAHTSHTSRNPRKRKGVFMDAVEVPTLHTVLMRRTASHEVTSSSSRSVLRTHSLPTGALPLQRTRSSSKLLPENDSPEKIQPSRKRAPPPPPRTVGGKRKRVDVLSQEDVFSSSSFMSSPLRRLKNMEAMGSDDSITLASPSLTVASTDAPSSDDLPHRYLGQVTPHRLVSPAVRRARDNDFFAEPSSDDSIMSASPSTDRVARMRLRKALPASNSSSPMPVASFLAALKNSSYEF